MDTELRYSTKKAHRRIFGQGQVNHTLNAIIKPDGMVSTEPCDIIQGTEAHFKSTRTTTVPGDLAGDVPWARDTDHRADDHFDLPKVSDRISVNYRVGHLYNRSIYDYSKNKLPGRKAPGVDGVPNEVLKHMPKVFHDNVHALFVYLWEQRVTPKQWKRG